MSDIYGPNSAYPYDQGQRDDPVYQKYLRRYMQGEGDGRIAETPGYQFNPQLSGTPFGPNVHDYYGPEPRDLAWQKDVYNAAQDRNDLFADAVTAILAGPGAYSVESMMGEQYAPPEAPTTPLIDAYTRTGGIYAELATAIAQGETPEAFVQAALESGAIADEDEAEQVLYRGNDLLQEKMEYDAALPQYQQAAAEYQATGGRGQSKFADLGLPEPWEQYGPADFVPEVTGSQQAMQAAEGQVKQLSRRADHEAKAARNRAYAKFLHEDAFGKEIPQGQWVGVPQGAANSKPQGTHMVNSEGYTVADGNDTLANLADIVNQVVYQARQQQAERQPTEDWIAGGAMSGMTGIPEQYQQGVPAPPEQTFWSPREEFQNSAAGQRTYQATPETQWYQRAAQDAARQASHEWAQQSIFGKAAAQQAAAQGRTPLNDAVAMRNAYMRYMAG